MQFRAFSAIKKKVVERSSDFLASYCKSSPSWIPSYHWVQSNDDIPKRPSKKRGEVQVRVSFRARMWGDLVTSRKGILRRVLRSPSSELAIAKNDIDEGDSSGRTTQSSSQSCTPPMEQALTLKSLQNLADGPRARCLQLGSDIIIVLIIIVGLLSN